MEKKFELVRRANFRSSDLIDLLASHDTLLKKLTCDYLVDKASVDMDLSLLTANALLRDASDPNPSVRRASLLALSSLPDMGEAGVAAVRKAVADQASQVRRATPQCCVNLFRHCPAVVLASGLVDLLYEGIRDPDPITTSNCFLALEAILAEEGGLVVNRNIALHLASNLRHFSDCNVVYALHILKKYVPKRDEDLFSVLNELDTCLLSASAPVLMAAMQLFMTLTKDFKHLWRDLFETVKATTAKLASQSNPETCFFFIEFVQKAPETFHISLQDQFRLFIPKAKDPLYLKARKLTLLPLIVGKDDASEVIAEVKHYTVHYQSYREAFACLRALHALYGDVEAEVLTVLAQAFVNVSVHVVEAALHCLLSVELQTRERSGRNIILSEDFSHAVNSVIGRHGGLQDRNPPLVLRTVQVLFHIVDNVQELFEDLIKHMDPESKIQTREDSGLDTQEDSSHGTVNSIADGITWDPVIRCLFLTTCCLVFLHRPAVMQPILSMVLSRGLRDPQPAVVSHAAFLYAALEEGPEEALKLLAISDASPF